MKPFRRRSLLDLKLEAFYWRIHRFFESQDIEQLIGWSLVGVMYVWLLWLVVLG